MSTASAVLGLPAGLTHRAVTADDASIILPLVVACDVAVLGASEFTLEEVTSSLAFPGVDNDRGGRLVLDESGAVVGWLWTEFDGAAVELFIDVFALDPIVRAWLFAWGADYAASLVAASGIDLTLRAGCYAEDIAYASVLGGYGLTVVRRFFGMRLTFDPAQVYLAGPLPIDLVIQQAETDDAGLQVLYQLHSSSFRDHWHSIPRSFDEWLERLRASAGVDPAQWYVARVNGEPAGLLLADESRTELNESYIPTLGVLREFRGRGVAKALLGHAFSLASQRGRLQVGLHVDSESLTGATKLYEGMGMSVVTQLLSWRGPVVPRVK